MSTFPSGHVVTEEESQWESLSLNFDLQVAPVSEIWKKRGMKDTFGDLHTTRWR